MRERETAGGREGGKKSRRMHFIKDSFPKTSRRRVFFSFHEFITATIQCTLQPATNQNRLWQGGSEWGSLFINRGGQKCTQCTLFIAAAFVGQALGGGVGQGGGGGWRVGWRLLMKKIFDGTN